MTIERITSQSSLSDPITLSPSALADRWGCSRQTVYNMIRKGQLRSFNIGTLRLILPDEIERIERGGEE